MPTSSKATALLLIVTGLAIGAFLGRMGCVQDADATPTPAGDRYEGSSGMGADGFGGWPSKSGPRAR